MPLIITPVLNRVSRKYGLTVEAPAHLAGENFISVSDTFFVCCLHIIGHLILGNTTIAITQRMETSLIEEKRKATLNTDRSAKKAP